MRPHTHASPDSISCEQSRLRGKSLRNLRDVRYGLRAFNFQQRHKGNDGGPLVSPGTPFVGAPFSSCSWSPNISTQSTPTFSLDATASQGVSTILPGPYPDLQPPRALHGQCTDPSNVAEGPLLPPPRGLQTSFTGPLVHQPAQAHTSTHLAP